jgi:hypothetical protein
MMIYFQHMASRLSGLYSRRIGFDNGNTIPIIQARLSGNLTKKQGLGHNMQTRQK